MPQQMLTSECVPCLTELGAEGISAIWADEIVFSSIPNAQTAFTSCAGCLIKDITIRERNCCKINPQCCGNNGFSFTHTSKSDVRIQHPGP